jgi:predicted DsbA family dithiol-disulfide isomerase
VSDIATDPGHIAVEPIRISYFSDILCVWAYIAQVRIEELQATFGAEVVVEPHFVSIFGNAREKLEARWKERGGLPGYARHVRDAARPHTHVTVNPDTWAVNPPTSSLSCHLFLCAVRSAARTDPAAMPETAFQIASRALRRAFFENASDISQLAVQREVATTIGIPLGPVDAALASGAAHAALARDLDLARDLTVTVSPTLVFNEGRQRLNGNVGYRVIEANIRELLREPAGEHSWC